MIKIPHEQLSADALRGVVEEFVMREGTDYGHRDYSLDEKRKRVVRALETGAAAVTFDPESASTTIVMLEDLD